MALLGTGFTLFALNLHSSGQISSLSDLFEHAVLTDINAVLLIYGALPRLIVALAAGALLGLSTALLRQALQNPLAEPGTLGILASARFSVAVALIWLPGIARLDVPVVAGCAAAILLVLGLSVFRSFQPLFVVLNGMVLGLCLDAATAMLLLSHFEELGELMIWQSGSLVQDNWHAATILPICLAITGLATYLLRRPLAWLDLDDAPMRGAGLSPPVVRALALALGTLAAAAVTVQTGVIAFVGLAGAAMAQSFGSRSAIERAVFSAVFGAGLLLVTDQAVQQAEAFFPIPAGTVTALFAAPVLLILLRRSRASAPRETARPWIADVRRPAGKPHQTAIAVLAVAAVAILCICVGRTENGLTFDTGPELAALLEFRWPRLLAAASTGGLLAFAGCLMQRMTGNDLASPELLGISSGAALTMLPAILPLPVLDRSQTMLIASAGALVFLFLSLRLSARSGFAPERLLLNGLAITALAGSLLSVVAFLGDPRIMRLLGWLSGSTYRMSPSDALMSAALLGLALASVPFLNRWLRILPLGEATSRALGLELRTARLVFILLTALATGAATVMIGPVSFVGLIAPHLARLAGFRAPHAQALAATGMGAALLTLADWLGRVIAFPWELPAGLVVTALGALIYCGLVARK